MNAQRKHGSLGRRMTRPFRRLGAVAAGALLVMIVSVAVSPAAEASVTTNYWWGKSTWYSQSEVRKMQPVFRRMTDLAAGGGGTAAGSVCAAASLAYVVPGLVCGVMVGAGVWFLSDQASRLDYASARGMCARFDTRLGLTTVTPYSCNWR